MDIKQLAIEVAKHLVPDIITSLASTVETALNKLQEEVAQLNKSRTKGVCIEEQNVEVSTKM